MTGRALAIMDLALLSPGAAGAGGPPPQPVTEWLMPAHLPDGHQPWPVRAEFVAPTDRYPHGILGRIPGWGGLVIDLQLCGACDHSMRQVRIDLPENRVFEDIAPRLWDITGDGRPEIVAVESDAEQGARLTVWEARTGEDNALVVSLLAATPFIGTRFRWLAPVEAADFTGDGVAEIAYVETPHRARILRLVTLRGNRLEEIAHLEGVTNHAIGEERIHGGIRICHGQPEIIAQSADRSDVLIVRLEDGQLSARVVGSAADEGIWDQLQSCAE